MTILSVAKNAEQLKFSYIATGRNENGIVVLENSLAIQYKVIDIVKYTLIIGPSNLTLLDTLRKLKTSVPHIQLYITVYSRFIHN